MNKQVPKQENKPRPSPNRYSSDQIATIRSVFLGNDELLSVLRRVFLQGELSEDNVTLLKKVFSNNEVFNVVKKCYLPELEFDAAIGQPIDLWMVVEVRDKDMATQAMNIMVQDRMIQLIQVGLERLVNPNMAIPAELAINSFKISTSQPSEDSMVELFARNKLIAYNEVQLTQLKTLAEMKDETPEEMKARLRKNSSQ